MVLAEGLSATAPHSVLCYFLKSLQSEDRWWKGPADVIRVRGLLLDSGAQLRPPVLRPKRMIAFWDSIGEGTWHEECV